MKTLKLLSLMLLSALLSCSDDKSEITGEVDEGKGTLVINSTETKGTKSSSGTSYELGDLETAIITIEQNGEVLEGYDAKEVQLEKWGESSITISGIELDNGIAYSITEFELKNEDKATTFASPIEGSQAANWVQQALPIKFEIKVDETTEVEIQVVTTLGATPEDFGYNKFTFDDETPKVQAYLENIETIFLDKGEKMVHHFTKRGIPTYSEIYRKHAVNTHVDLDYIAETIKHYYIDDETSPEKLTIEYHTDSNIREYSFKSFHASGNVAEMESSTGIWEFDDKGLLTKYTSHNEAGVNDYGWYEYLYNENGYLLEKKEFDVEGEYKFSYKYTVDNEGNQLSEIREKANGDIIYPKYNWTYTDGKKSGREIVYLDDNDEEFIGYKVEYEYDASGLLAKKIETQDFGETIIATTEFIYDDKKLTKSIFTKSNDPNYRSEQYYDELGYAVNVETNQNVYDFRGRLIESHYQEEDYKIVDFYNMEAELAERRYYNLNGILIKTIYPNDRILRKYWSNGQQKTYIRYNNVDILAEEELTEIEVNYKNPKEYDEFDLLNYIEYISEFDEEGIRQYRSYVRNIPTNDGNYPNGRIIEVKENQYRKEGGDYITIKQTICNFYYELGTSSYCDPSQLYMYSVAEFNLETGESDIRSYYPNGTQM